MKTKTVIWMLAVWLGWTAVSWGDLSYLVPNQEDKPAGLTVDMGGQWATGRFGKAAYLGRQGDSSIHFKDQEAVRVGNNSFSLLMWLCPDTLKTKDATIYRRILLKINKKNEFWVLDVYEDGRLMFSMRDLAGHYASTKSDPVLKAGKVECNRGGRCFGGGLDGDRRGGSAIKGTFVAVFGDDDGFWAVRRFADDFGSRVERKQKVVGELETIEADFLRNAEPIVADEFVVGFIQRIHFDDVEGNVIGLGDGD